MNQSTREFDIVRTVKKFFVSGFVILTFVAYALHEHFSNQDAGARAMSSQGTVTTQQSVATPQADSPATAPPAPTSAAAAPSLPTFPAVALASPTPLSTATVRPSGQYKDGAFTGAQVDAFWGYVQVKAVIRNGKLADVQFLEYPSDRRTSVRINNIAMPDLKMEAMQVQAANVDIISGATLTSEAFADSLQTALESAKN